MLLPDGRAFFIGGNGHTAFYAPSGDISPGTWTQGPDLPNGMVMQDAPAAMLPNGKVLCAVSAPSNHNPVYFYEYRLGLEHLRHERSRSHGRLYRYQYHFR